MVQREFNSGAMMIREENGKHRPATSKEIIKAAKCELSVLFQRGAYLDKPDAVKDYLQFQLAQYEHEIFGALWLDNRHCVITFEEIFRGTIDGAAVYPREVLKAALRHNAAACIFYHNHPSGVSDPSECDKRITERLKEALALVEVRVLDHLIIGEQSYSFAEHGLF